MRVTLCGSHKMGEETKRAVRELVEVVARLKLPEIQDTEQTRPFLTKTSAKVLQEEVD